MRVGDIHLPEQEIEAICRKWKIRELCLFGSVLREDFRPDSDIDVLISFEPGTHWPWGGYADIEQELSALLGRRVDVVDKAAITQSENYIRRRHILNSAESVYVAR